MLLNAADSSKNPDAQHAAGAAVQTEDDDLPDHAPTDTFKSLNPGPKPRQKAGPKPGLPDGPKPGLPDGPKPGLPDGPKPGLPDDLMPGIEITLGDTASPNPPIDTDSIEDQMEVEITASRKALSDEAILKMRSEEKAEQSAEEKKSGLLRIFSRARKN